MHQSPIPKTIDSGCHHPANQSARPVLHQAPFLRTHVDTEVAAQMLLVDPKTLHKSHSKKGNYAGVRPVRLPSRKLAWPLAEIEKLLDGR